MTTYTVLIILSGLVIFSYLLDLFAKKTRFPSVLLLLMSGIALRYLTDYLGVATFDFLTMLPLIGTVGLILIVLEASLELKIERETIPMIKKSLGSAFFTLLVTSFSITLFLRFVTDQPFQSCFINSIPYSVLSSAIVIPSAANLAGSKKEFVIYESVFSDILGIIFFNFALANAQLTTGAFLNLGFDMILVLLISLAASFFLLYAMGRIRHNIKSFLIISILTLVYAVGKQLHLSSLIIVFAFGLFLNNIETLRLPAARRLFLYEGFGGDMKQMASLTAESAFVIKTFFFLIFGFVINPGLINDAAIFIYGAAILACIYLFRFVYLKVFVRNGLVPEFFIAPRGLISILLFFNIPVHLRIEGAGEGLLLLIIFSTNIMMAVGLLKAKAA